MTNRIEQARTAAYQLVCQVAAGLGLDPARIERNIIIGTDGDGAGEASDGEDRRRPGAPAPLWQRVTVEDAQDEAIEVLGESLGVRRYDLKDRVRVAVTLTGASITGADAVHAQALLAAFGTALGQALADDPTMGGAADYASLADGGDRITDRSDGQELRGEIYSIDIELCGALTPRG